MWAVLFFLPVAMSARLWMGSVLFPSMETNMPSVLLKVTLVKIISDSERETQAALTFHNTSYPTKGYYGSTTITSLKCDLVIMNVYHYVKDSLYDKRHICFVVSKHCTLWDKKKVIWYSQVVTSGCVTNVIGVGHGSWRHQLVSCSGQWKSVHFRWGLI